MSRYWGYSKRPKNWKIKEEEEEPKVKLEPKVKPVKPAGETSEELKREKPALLDGETRALLDGETRALLDSSFSHI